MTHLSYMSENAITDFNLSAQYAGTQLVVMVETRGRGREGARKRSGRGERRRKRGGSRDILLSTTPCYTVPVPPSALTSITLSHHHPPNFALTLSSLPVPLPPFTFFPPLLPPTLLSPLSSLTSSQIVFTATRASGRWSGGRGCHASHAKEKLGGEGEQDEKKGRVWRKGARKSGRDRRGKSCGAEREGPYI